MGTNKNTDDKCTRSFFQHVVKLNRIAREYVIIPKVYRTMIHYNFKPTKK